MHKSTEAKRAGILKESQIALSAPLYGSVRGSQISCAPKSITEISNKLDSRFKIHTEGITSNQKVYKGK